VSMGYEGVFTHVGDGVRIQAPNGKSVAPIITGMSSLEDESKLSIILLGSFGSSDATFSLLGGKLTNNAQPFHPDTLFRGNRCLGNSPGTVEGYIMID
jgi:hypothetical protein